MLHAVSIPKCIVSSENTEPMVFGSKRKCERRYALGTLKTKQGSEIELCLS